MEETRLLHGANWRDKIKAAYRGERASPTPHAHGPGLPVPLHAGAYRVNVPVNTCAYSCIQLHTELHTAAYSCIQLHTAAYRQHLTGGLTDRNWPAAAAGSGGHFKLLIQNMASWLGALSAGGAYLQLKQCDGNCAAIETTEGLLRRTPASKEELETHDPEKQSAVFP